MAARHRRQVSSIEASTEGGTAARPLQPRDQSTGLRARALGSDDEVLVSAGRRTTAPDLCIAAALARLDLRQELTQVIRYVASAQPCRKERPDEPAEPFQMPNRDNLDPASILSGCDMELPRTSRLEEVRVEHSPPQASRLRPVVAKPLPDKPRPPRVSLSHIGPRLAPWIVSCSVPARGGWLNSLVRRSGLSRC